MDEPLTNRQAESLIREIVSTGYVWFTPHALSEMDADRIDREEAICALRRGRTVGKSLREGTWRYKCEFIDVTMVVAFRSEGEFAVITGWRDDA